MCGIVACLTQRPATDYLLPALRRLEYRGYDSVGIAVNTRDGVVARLRSVERIDALESAVLRWTGAPFSNAGIGHTRWATHGGVSMANAHPLTDCSHRISLVHNGIIENAEVLRRRLERTGHRFESAVDSEVICHLIEDQQLDAAEPLEAVRRALSFLEGSWAIAALDETSGRIIVSCHRSPLLIAHSTHGVFVASDIAAVGEWVEKFRVVDDGEVLELCGEEKHRRSPAGAAVFDTTRDVGGIHEPLVGGYVDYMAKEIDEQPIAAARLLAELTDGVADGSLWRSLSMASFERLRIVGCGTSLNAGHVIANLVRRLGGVPACLTVASEANSEVVEPGTVCLAISQSGETADVLQAVTACAQPGTLLGLTNNAHSTLARSADAFISCHAGPEIGVAATKTFVCQVIAGSAVMISALVATGRLSRSCAAGLVEKMECLPQRLTAASAAAALVVPDIAEKYCTATGFVFIARGTGVPYAAEGALKLKELTYRWAEAYPAGELKHGPLALVGSGTPVIVVRGADKKLAANIAEVEARGGHVISVGTAGSTIPAQADLTAPWGPLECVIPLQMLARTVGLTLGWDVDKPRNLAKSVTVE